MSSDPGAPWLASSASASASASWRTRAVSASMESSATCPMLRPASVAR